MDQINRLDYPDGYADHESSQSPKNGASKLKVKGFRKLLGLFKKPQYHEHSECNELNVSRECQVCECETMSRPFSEARISISKVKIIPEKAYINSRIATPATETLLNKQPEMLSFEEPPTHPSDYTPDVAQRSITEVGGNVNRLAYMTNDPCGHCAAQGLDINAKDARKNMELYGGGEISSSFFRSTTRTGCEFPYSLKCFTPEPVQWPITKQMEMIMLFKDMCCGDYPMGSRIILRLNDHLRGQEGVRGWVIQVEGKSPSNVSTLLCQVDQYFSERHLSENLNA